MAPPRQARRALRIAFYAPLKAPDHPVPSGDRTMARLLQAALVHAGHHVETVSTLRAWLREPAADAIAALTAQAAAERTRIAAQWRAGGAPDLWFCYHPYYRAPDLLGPPLAAQFGLPWVSAEASWAGKREADAWAPLQAAVTAALTAGALHLCFTERDRTGLARVVPAARLAVLAPFIDAPPPLPRPARAPDAPPALIAVAMMRPGAKLDSHRRLAAALGTLLARPWHLTLVGDGPARAEVEAAYAAIPATRLSWTGELDAAAVATRLAAADVYVWPGCGEAYGLAYLEAQAAGLPVVALATAGVPAVVRDGETGLLAAPDVPEAYAAALARLLDDAALRTRLGAAAQRFVHGERTLAAAAARLGARLDELSLPRDDARR